MATMVFTDAKVLVDKYDISGDLNNVSLAVGAEMVEATTYGAAARIKKPGMYTVEYNMNGYCNFGTGLSEEGLFAKVGTVDIPQTLAAGTIALGSICYFFKGAFAQYSPGGNVGEMLSFTANGGVSGGAAIRGYILEAGAAMKTSSANGTEVLVGAQSATQRLYAIVHVLEKQGTAPTLDLLIQSDVTGFGTPTTKVTFAQFNDALGSSYATPVAGPNTDTYYRCSWTIGGSASPGYRFVAAVGIL